MLLCGSKTMYRTITTERMEFMSVVDTRLVFSSGINDELNLLAGPQGQGPGNSAGLILAGTQQGAAVRRQRLGSTNKPCLSVKRINSTLNEQFGPLIAGIFSPHD
ncbi:hypothetical protein VTK26DRAFT_7621 [Humicola hyalothermophila]